MRLREQVLSGIAQIVVPILVVPRMVAGLDAQVGLLVGIYVAEYFLWQLHHDAVDDAYRQGRRDAELGPES